MVADIAADGIGAAHGRGLGAAFDVLAEGNFGEFLAGGILEGGGEAAVLGVGGGFVHAEARREGRPGFGAAGDLQLAERADELIDIGGIGRIAVTLGHRPLAVFAHEGDGAGGPLDFHRGHIGGREGFEQRLPRRAQRWRSGSIAFG